VISETVVVLQEATAEKQELQEACGKLKLIVADGHKSHAKPLARPGDSVPLGLQWPRTQLEGDNPIDRSLAYRQLVLAAHDKCLKADILPLNKKQVSDNVKKRKKAKKAGRAAAAQQQPQTSITNATAGVSVEAATDTSDITSALMDVAVDDSDAEAASAGVRLSLLSPIVLGPAQRQPDDQATLATPLRPKRKRIAAIRSEPTDVTPEKPSGNMRPRRSLRKSVSRSSSLRGMLKKFI
jgi:hypothetical protein